MAPAAIVAPALAVPPPAGRRRERDRGTHFRSSPPELILSDDDAKTSDSGEVARQHSELFESGDNDTGSNSESGSDDAETGSGAESGDDVDSGSGSETDSDNSVDGDSAPESSPSRKRMKRASQA